MYQIKITSDLRCHLTDSSNLIISTGLAFLLLQNSPCPTKFCYLFWSHKHAFCITSERHCHGGHKWLKDSFDGMTRWHCPLVRHLVETIIPEGMFMKKENFALFMRYQDNRRHSPISLPHCRGMACSGAWMRQHCLPYPNLSAKHSKPSQRLVWSQVQKAQAWT